MFSEIWQFIVDNIFVLLVLLLFIVSCLIVGLVFWKYSLAEIRQLVYEHVCCLVFLLLAFIFCILIGIVWRYYFLQVVSTGTPRCTASPMYRRVITLSKIVGSVAPWYGSIKNVETHRTIPGRHGFDHFGQSYSSAVHWACGTLACSQLKSSNLTTQPSIT
uniref:Uncharacterized protein n=1 Tax=Meloidogyne incognita TaxID=6306 RepID=A0A914MFN1_MELIC